MTTVEVPNIGTVEFPDSMGQAQIVAAIQKMRGPSRPMPSLGHRRGIDPNTGKFDPTLATIDDVMANPPAKVQPSSGIERLGQTFQGRVLPNKPLVFGTAASIAFPPLAAGRAVTALPGLIGLLSRGAQRFGPSMLASGTAAGATAGAIEAGQTGATAASIAREALGTGAKFAGAELAGAGIGAAAGRIIAPRLTFLDPLKGFRQEFGAFVKTIPERARNAWNRVEELIPEGSAQNAANRAAEAAVNASRVVKELTKQNALGKSASKAAKEFGNRHKTAEAVARALGEKAAKRFGYQGREGSQRFLFRVLSSGNEQVLKTVRKRLGKKSLEDFQLQTLSTLITRASRRGRDGELRLDGDRLKQLWDELPETAKSMYSPGAQRAVESLATFGSATSRLARFAASPTGSELAEAIITPLAFSAGGPALGIPIMVARQLLSPGLLTRYLTRDTLPSEVKQMLAGQTVKTGLRTGLMEETR